MCVQLQEKDTRMMTHEICLSVKSKNSCTETQSIDCILGKRLKFREQSFQLITVWKESVGIGKTTAKLTI